MDLLMASKLKSYDAATKKLMLQAQDLDVSCDGSFSLPEMVFLLRESFKYKLTYKRVFNEILRNTYDPATGFCIVSSYYIYLHTGGDKIWRLVHNPAHWWLVHRQTGNVFDITYTQFNEPFPYEIGTDEVRLKTDPEFVKVLRDKALILGRSAGME